MGNPDFILMKIEEIVIAKDSEECDNMPRLWHELSAPEQRKEPSREGVQMVRIEMIEDESIHFYELEQRDILAEDDAEERLAGSLKICLKNWNQNSNVLIEKKRKLGQHTEMLTEEGKDLRYCGFCFNKCLMNADPVDDGDKLTAWGSQLKEKENSVEYFQPWNGEIELLESMLNQQDSIQERKPQFKNWGLQNVKTQWDEDRKELLIESSVGTIGSWGFGTNEVAVLTGKAEDNPSLGVVLEE